MFKSFLNKLYGNAVVLSNLPKQSHLPFDPIEKLHAHRDKRLREIIHFAAKTVPYYQNLFRTLKLDPQEIRSAEDLGRLPLIDKERVRNDPSQFVSCSHRGRKAILFLTSGSTGARLKIWHDRHSLLSNIASGEREREVITKVCGRRQGLKELYILAKHFTTKAVWSFYEQHTFIPIRPRRLYLTVLDPVEDIVRNINGFHPDILIGFGSYLETFFRLLSSRKISVPPPKVVLYVAEGMTPEGRILIEEKFHIPVLSQYNAVEAFKIGFFCEERRGFHLHEDLCHLKIVNEKKQKVGLGEKGELVISNLINHGTVLLNYRIGDLASFSKERCPCGRTLPLLSELEGRVEDILFLPNENFIHPRVIWGIMKSREEVLKYQLIQHTPEHYELKLVTPDKNTYRQIVQGVLEDLKNVLGSSSKIEPAYYEALTPQEGGKFRPVLSLSHSNELTG